MFGNFFENYFMNKLADNKLKEANRLLMEAKTIKESAESYRESIDFEMSEKLNAMQSKIDFHVARVAELEQKVKIYEDLILKFNLFEKKS